MGTLANGSIDLKSLKVAGEGASKYITAIDGGGIKVHDVNNMDVNYALINAEGMTVFQGEDVATSIPVAKFGSTTTIGRNWQVLIDGSSVNIIDNTQEEAATIGIFDNDGITFYDGDGIEEKNIVAEFGINGASIGAENSTSKARFTADGFNVIDSNLLNIITIGKGETLSNHYHYTERIGGGLIDVNVDSDNRTYEYIIRVSSSPYVELTSPQGTITLSIPWTIYNSSGSITSSGTETFTFSADTTETKVDAHNSLQVTYNASHNRLIIEHIGNYYQSYVFDHFKLGHITGQAVIVGYVHENDITSTSSLYLHSVIKFVGDTTKTFNFNHTFTHSELPANGQSITYSTTYSGYTFKYQVQKNSVSYSIRLIQTVKGSYGNAYAIGDSYIRYFTDGIVVNPSVIDYYGTAEAPFYDFGQRTENTTKGAYSLIVGQDLIAAYPRSFAMGKFNDDDESYAFQIGNGVDNNNRSNALTVDWDGNMVIPNNSAYKSKNLSGDKRRLCYISTTNGYIYGYDSYQNSEGGSYLYGNTTNIRSKGAISIGRATDNNTIYINGVTYPSTNIVMPNNVSLRGKTANGNNNYQLIFASDSNNIVVGSSSWNDCYIHRVYSSGTGTVSTVPNVRILDNSRLTRTTHANSSIKIKHDIKDIENKELDPHRLYGVEVKQFIYNDDVITDKNDCRYHKEIAGFIAEQLHECYPIAVDINEKGECEAWQAQYIIPPMLKLIQEQHEEIEQLKKEVAELKNK